MRGVVDVLRLALGKHVEPRPVRRGRDNRGVAADHCRHLVAHRKLHSGLLLALRDALVEREPQVPLVLDLAEHRDHL